MKKYLLLTFLGLCSVVYAQDIRINKFRNEITVRKRNTINRDVFRERGMYEDGRQAQLWLRVFAQGRFRVEVGGQMMENSTGRYRFFDLNRGIQMLSIYENGNILVYRTQVELRENTRLLLDFDGYDLYLFGEENIEDNGIQVYPNIGGYKPMMSNEEFGQFYRSYAGKPFDKDKMETFYVAQKGMNFTTQQIVQMVKALSFDDNRLELAKTAYDNCVDRENYYKVVDAMTYSSTKEKLREYILKR